MAEGSDKPTERDWRPVPDPTLLTSAALREAVGSLEEKLISRLEGMRDTIEARLDASDRANLLAEQQLTRVPTLLDKEMGAARALTDSRFASMDRQFADLGTLREEKFASIHQQVLDLLAIQTEKFSSIQTQFAERDTRTEQSNQASKQAIDAALSAAEKAVNKQADAFSVASSKTEAAFTKQVDQLSELLKANTTALDDKINDAKDRLNRIEGQAVGKLEIKADTHGQTGTIVAIISIIISGIAVLATILWHFSGK